MIKACILFFSVLSLAGCTTIVDGPTPPRGGPKVVQYQPGMKIPEPKPYIDSKGNINSMYDPIVHCHTLYHPGQPPQKVCRIVR